ncbi:response regulator [Pseudomonas guariconensis]|uniref:Response regulator n=1 Tax=Pseudomonas guariconensis TaxID=1288410 RepID=A0AAX0VUY3_9PSED|nr:response regulator [Pseudomonas guariconensis]PLV17843.1 response regulator [Pseudomonas guariconensis]PLV22569.1 response regulator [Pseudomonas guariconensis]PLV27592.1 response regulator [Pseudomonas guariconensis]
MNKLEDRPPTCAPNVLIVEDDSLIRELLAFYLEENGASVKAVATADEGRDELMSQRWALMLIDVQTPGMLNGVDLAWIASQQRLGTRIVVMSGYFDFAGRALPDGAVFLTKPWPMTKLREIIAKEFALADVMELPAT